MLLSIIGLVYIILIFSMFVICKIKYRIYFNYQMIVSLSFTLSILTYIFSLLILYSLFADLYKIYFENYSFVEVLIASAGEIVGFVCGCIIFTYIVYGIGRNIHNRIFNKNINQKKYKHNIKISNAEAQCTNCLYIYDFNKKSYEDTYIECPYCGTKGVIEKDDQPN